MNTIRIHDLSTGEIIDRPETPVEKKAREAEQAEIAIENAAVAQAAANREAVLAALAAAAGLEVDEVKAVLG